MPTDDRVMRLLRERGRVTQSDICKECSVPYHMCMQVMQRVAKNNADVRFENGALYLDV